MGETSDEQVSLFPLFSWFLFPIFSNRAKRKIYIFKHGKVRFLLNPINISDEVLKKSNHPRKKETCNEELRN